MIIVGAGMAGLLAANMLIRRNPTIWEAQSALPNNHSAVLRFRSSVVGDVLGIPFRKVSMLKCSVPWLNPVSDCLAYSYKCTGQYLSDRSITSILNTEQRYIAPINLVERMADGLDIFYNRMFGSEDVKGEPIISTVPMPILMKILDYEDPPDFNYVSGYNIKCYIKHCDAFVSVLIPEPNIPISRISLTGNELTIELPRVGGEHVLDSLPKLVEYSLALLSINSNDVDGVRLHNSVYAKITSIDDDTRKRFIAWATDQFNIYSLGRFATWRPGLLLDDLVQDIRHIERWTNRNDNYALRQFRNTGE